MAWHSKRIWVLCVLCIRTSLDLMKLINKCVVFWARLIECIFFYVIQVFCRVGPGRRCCLMSVSSSEWLMNGIHVRDLSVSSEETKRMDTSIYRSSWSLADGRHDWRWIERLTRANGILSTSLLSYSRHNKQLNKWPVMTTTKAICFPFSSRVLWWLDSLQQLCLFQALFNRSRSGAAVD